VGEMREEGTGEGGDLIGRLGESNAAGNQRN
jgi:hypothetical protein